MASHEALVRLVFEPGFSTAASVTTISGRGVGLSVARETVIALQGSFDVAQQARRGHAHRAVAAGQRPVAAPAAGLVQGPDLRAADRVGRARAARRPRRSGHHRGPAGGAPRRIDAAAGVDRRDPRPRRSGRHQRRLGHLRRRGARRGRGQRRLRHPSRHRRRRLHRRQRFRRQERRCRPRATAACGRGSSAPRTARPAWCSIRPPSCAQEFDSADIVFRSEKREADRAKVVLVVDDSITTRTLEKSILEAHGYEVRLSVDGRNALAVLRSDPPDIVVSDIEMPHVDGFELVRAMKNDKALSEIPVILVTSRSDDEDREKGLQARRRRLCRQAEVRPERVVADHPADHLSDEEHIRSWWSKIRRSRAN